MAGRALFLSVAWALSLVACGGDEVSTEAGGSRGPYQLTVRGDGTFQVLAGKTLRAALHLKADNRRLDVAQTTVVADTPAFSVTFAPMLDPATQYHLHYWFDVDGDGVCDSPDVDEQWAVDPPLGEAIFEVTRRASDVSHVCGSFQ
jgi:hypothetical protein